MDSDSEFEYPQRSSFPLLLLEDGTAVRSKTNTNTSDNAKEDVFPASPTDTTADSHFRSPTPTTTISQPDFSLSVPHETYRAATPWPGSTFLLYNVETSLILALSEGNLKLTSLSNSRGGGQWLCAEDEGWLGFKNVVSGTWLGHNGNSDLQAIVKHHKPYEHFCVRRKPPSNENSSAAEVGAEETYVLLNRKDNKLCPVAVQPTRGNDWKLALAGKNQAASWTFLTRGE